MVVLRSIMRPTSRGKSWTSLINRAVGEHSKGWGYAGSRTPALSAPSEGLDLNFFGGLSPRWAVANLYGFLATKIPAKDIFDRGSHLLLEPECHLSGLIFRAL